ncbi:MAG: type II toxin-antitoxin system Phd/YefM family antitoxin [Chloroflexota bacterium]
MTEVGVHEAKTHLSRLLRRVAAGEEIVITSGGKPAARLVPFNAGKAREFGSDRGLFEVPDDFDDPLPEDLLDEFYK